MVIHRVVDNQQVTHIDESTPLAAVVLRGASEQRVLHAILVQVQVGQHVHRMLEQMPIHGFAAALRLHQLEQAVHDAVQHLQA